MVVNHMDTNKTVSNSFSLDKFILLDNGILSKL